MFYACFAAEIGAKACGTINKMGGCGSGKETLRLRSKGAATIEMVISSHRFGNISNGQGIVIIVSGL